jgi:ATP-dependent Lon protease
MKRTKGSEDNVAMHALLKLLDSKGEVRALKCLPKAWHEILEKLESDFPNFVEVIDYLRGQFSLSGSDASVISFDSFLLDGPPGVGKSYFAEELGRRLEVPFRAIRMENAQSNAQLVGSDEFWSSSRAGVIFDTLVQGDVANPLFFLDEIEKAAGDKRFNPISGLYSLLERGTAKSFADLAWPWLELDASHVNWMLASNEAWRLPEPIRSRVRVFSIPPPTAEQSRRIALRMFRQLQREIPVAKEMRLTCAAVKLIGALPPRIIKKRLKEAVGGAAYEKRRRIDSNDIERTDSQKAKGSIGFVSS